MKMIECENLVRFLPESKEEENLIKKHFPEEYLKGSKIMKVKSMVDAFGNVADGRYIEIKGNEAINRKVREKKSKPEVVHERVEPSDEQQQVANF